VPESLQPVAQGPNWTGNDMTLLVRFPVATGHERSIFETFFTVLPSIGDSYVGGFHRGPPDCIARLRGSQSQRAGDKIGSARKTENNSRRSDGPLDPRKKCGMPIKKINNLILRVC
jgi:hypothetical protein